MSTPNRPAAAHVSLLRELVVILFARTVLDTGYRAVYPFLPFIASNLGVPVATAAVIIQVRNLTGFASPLFGPLSDHYGRRALMLAGLAISVLTGIILWFVVPFWLVVVVMTLMGLSTVLFVPAQQAFLGDSVPYTRRGRVMAIAEVAWSLAAIIGLPIVGIIVERAGWRAAFVAVGVLAAAAFVAVGLLLAHDKRTATRAARALGGSYAEALRAPMALAVLCTTFLLAATNENINVIFGAWMRDSFNLTAVDLGLVGAAIGGAELFAELFAAGFVDRIGKWRLVAVGLLLGVGAYLVLPLLSVNALGGSVGLVGAFMFFELAVVAALPLITELAPLVRATLLSMGVATFALGRAVGSFTGPLLFANYGFPLTSFVSAGGILIACIIWLVFVREKRAEAVSA